MMTLIKQLNKYDYIKHYISSAFTRIVKKYEALNKIIKTNKIIKNKI